MVDQYTYQIGEPFVVFAMKMDTKEEVREKIMFRLLSMRVEYEYGRDAEKKALMSEVSDEQKNNFMMYYVDYKASRRTVIYDDFTMREPSKDETFLEYKTGSNSLSIGIEF
jgi:hypothetical protein